MPAEGRDERLAEFSERLMGAMKEKGWTQSELARRASAYLDDEISRQNVYKYTKGIHAPEPERMFALASALEVEPEWLLPGGVHRYDAPLTPRPAIELRGTGKPGTIRLRIDQEVPTKVALKIAALLEGVEETD